MDENEEYLLYTTILRYAGRDVCKVEMPNGSTQGFYLSTNVEAKNQWLPFDGIISIANARPWFNKTNFHQIPKTDHLYRYGTEELKQLSQILENNQIPEGKEATTEEINKFLLDKNNQQSLESSQSWETTKEETAPTGITLECEGMAFYLEKNSWEKTIQCFFRNLEGQWAPCSGIGVRFDGSANPEQSPYQGEDIPEDLQGYGTEENWQTVRKLRKMPPHPGRHVTPDAINRTISLGKNSNGHELQYIQIRKEFLAEQKQNRANALRPSTPQEENLPPEAQFLPTNTKGHDYVVGDIHGCTEQLMKLLDHVRFDPEKDRVICSGDLTDRGPNNLEALSLLNEPWFFATKGNHDHTLQIVLEATLENPTPEKIREAASYLHSANGTDWILEELHNPESIPKFKNALAKLKNLPLILTVGHGQKKFHVAHASLSTGDAITTLLTDKEIEALQDRKTRLQNPEAVFEDRRVAHYESTNIPLGPARNTAKTFCGHTPFREVVEGLHTFIDTGAGHNSPDAGLTMIEPSTGLQIKALTQENHILIIQEAKTPKIIAISIKPEPKPELEFAS